MEQRHRQFINSLVSLANESNRPLIECAIKEYVVLEGVGNFFNRAKTLAGNLKTKISSLANGSKRAYANVNQPRQSQSPLSKESTSGLKHREFTPKQEKARQFLIDNDRKTWENDYNRFLQACDDIVYFLKTYGNREFNQLRYTPDFKKAEKRGTLMDDYIRVNPQKIRDEHRSAYRNIMDSVCKISPQHRALVESILSIYDITEGVTRTRVIPLCESSNRDYAVSQLKSDMAMVEVFITRHGIYPWAKFLKSGEFRDAYANSASKNPTEEKETADDPKLAETVRDAYSTGYCGAMEAVDGQMKKLNRYLGKKPESATKDSKGYIDTTRKAFNYFKDAHIQEGAWAVHFTNEQAYPKIKKNGFANGTTVLDHLAYTAMYDGGRGKHGWLFALPVGCSYLKHYDLGYGDCAFLIKADGVIAKHVGEQDDELIFRDKDVIKKIPFRYDYDSQKWVVEPEDGKNEEFDTIGQVIEAYQD